jgi:branched-chain amino acid transport system ATP-binding protein
MVAIGRALMSNPRVLLCDEISLGLAPVIIKDIYKAVPKIRASGASMIVVEQDIGQAMAGRRPGLLHDGRTDHAFGHAR